MISLTKLKEAAPLLNLAELSRTMWGEQSNPSYWSRRLLEGSPEITAQEADQIRKALQPIKELLNEV